MLPLAKSFGGKSGRRVLIDDPYNDPDKGAVLEFRLTYQGLLMSTSNNTPQAAHKHDIRKSFHPQLKRLWEIVPHLNAPQKVIWPTQIWVGSRPPEPPPRSEVLAAKHTFNAFNFVPLVTEELSLICGIEILYLRPGYPGEIVHAGDVDNRIKTLFDALRIPQSGQLGTDTMPSEDEKPFYVLLEDDKLVTRLSVETDTLLSPTGQWPNKNDARLVITVKLRPAILSWENIAFG
jgi:hypothetical protein